MRLGIFTLLLVVFSHITLYSQPEVERERIFTGSGLYGYMNGGADQFLEYGVTRLVTRDLSYKEEKFTIDIYEMPSISDAFGIYSIRVFKCEKRDENSCVNCLSAYQYQAVKGNKYISVVFPSGSAKAKELAPELVELSLDAEEGCDPPVPEIMNINYPYSTALKYLKGPLSVSEVSRSLATYLQNIPYADVWFNKEKQSESYCALVNFQQGKDVELLKEQLPAEAILQQGEFYLYFKGEDPKASSPDLGPFGF